MCQLLHCVTDVEAIPKAAVTSLQNLQNSEVQSFATAVGSLMSMQAFNPVKLRLPCLCPDEGHVHIVLLPLSPHAADRLSTETCCSRDKSTGSYFIS